MELLLKSVLFILILIVSELNSQVTTTQCDYFQYRNGENGVHGYIKVHFRSSYVRRIHVQVEFTIAARLPSQSDVGNLDNNYVRVKNDGLHIGYLVNFPVVHPLPKLTSLYINNQQVCQARGDVLSQMVNHVATITLEHTLTLGSNNMNFGNDDEYNGVGIVGSRVPESPNSAPQPEPVYTNVVRPTQIDYNVVQVEPVRPPVRQPTYRPTYRPTYQPTYQPPPTQPPTPRPTPRPTPPPTPPPTSPPKTAAECGTKAGGNRAALIWYGDGYDRGEWPWLVAIYRRKDDGLNFICAGTLITDRHVLTAAHCMKQKSTASKTSDIVLRVGAFDLREWGDEITISRKLVSAHIHESYNADSLAHDILIMTMEKRVEFNDYIRSICLWSGDVNQNYIVSKTGVVTGWGNSENGPSGRGEPRAIRLPVVSTDTCKASKQDFHSLTSSYTLCAGNKNGSGPCLGDSGGGMYIYEQGRWRVRGIVSVSLRPESGEYNCDLNEYLIFTDAAQYLPWIYEILSSGN